MSPWIRILLIAVIAYFCGCFNGSVIVSKYILHDDVRNHGSGNAGLTNFFRTFGGPLTFAVILTDVLKAIIAVWAGILLSSSVDAGSYVVYAKYWAAAWCLLGHMYPCMFHFRGGKGILSGGAIVWMLDCENRPRGLGRISDSLPSDPLCVSGILLDRGLLPVFHLVCLPRCGSADHRHLPGRSGAV